MEGAGFIPGEQPVGGQRFDLSGVEAQLCVGEGAGSEGEMQVFGQLGGGYLGPDLGAGAQIELGGGRQGLQKLGKGGLVVRCDGLGQIHIEGLPSQLQLGVPLGTLV